MKSLSQTTSLSSVQSTPLSHHTNLSTDRILSKQSMHQSPRLISPPMPISRGSHSSTATMNPYSSTPNSSHHANTAPSYSSSMNTPSKYDFGLNTSHLHTSAASSGGSPAAASAVASYMHPNQLTQTAYGNVKSETNASNYDNYMNSCIQSGYIGGSFGSLGMPVPGAHVATDLAGYHHQHNVIQAAKLMASSWGGCHACIRLTCVDEMCDGQHWQPDLMRKGSSGSNRDSGFGGISQWESEANLTTYI